MPPIYSAQQFSDLEYCARLVQLSLTYEPPSFPVRDGIKRHFARALSRLFAGTVSPDTVIEDASNEFIIEASTRGFEHSIPLVATGRNAYSLIRDYACWLEGALSFIAAMHLTAFSPTDPVYIDRIPVLVDSWREQWQEGSNGTGDDGIVHLFRIVDRLPAPGELIARWPEYVSMTDASVREIRTHLFRLPAPSRDRIASPLLMAYRHPMTGRLRVAARSREKFGPNWKRVARWEMVDEDAIPWPEWQEGMERDECIGTVYREEILQVPEDKEEIRAIRRDISQMIAAISRPDLAVRKREYCQGCAMKGLCHPRNEEERSSYVSISSCISPEAGLLPPAAPQTSAPAAVVQSTQHRR